MMIPTGNSISVPRPVPFTLCLQALFDNSFSQFGWLFFGFSFLLLSWPLFHSEAANAWKYIGPLSTASGPITAIRKTGASENEHPIYAVEYTFTPPGQVQPLTGISYSTGEYGEKGETVTVEFRAGHPQYSRIRGLRSAELGWPILIFLIMPATGLALVLGKIVKGLRAIRLMRYGLPAQGTLVSAKDAGIMVQHQQLYRLQFRFSAQDGRQYLVKCATCDLKPAWQIVAYETALKSKMMDWRKNALTNAVTALRTQHPPQPDDLVETVYYLPDNPNIAASTLDFCRSFYMDAQGMIHDNTPGRGIRAAILPTLVLIGLCCVIRFLLTH